MNWFCALLAAVVLSVTFGLPFREYNGAKLLPVETLQISTAPCGVRLYSEYGNAEGENFAHAVGKLKEKAPGILLFDTAEYIVLCDPALLPQILESPLLRPGAQLYYETEPQDPKELGKRLSVHPGGQTLAQLRGAWAVFPSSSGGTP